MIDTIAQRRTTLNGKPIAKGDKVPMPLQQFQDLEPTGLFERAPAEKKTTVAAAKPAKVRSKAPTKAALPAPAQIAAASDTKSGDSAD
ncbi:hypothetical protein HNO88_001580 [Novosphingobium chloroacetimidivorans]|uniref:Uncharacterized protein n=1 Tax=Novosphingobium chloroacetimidivorans TaxID=1428314 RepID=A0A7W7NVH7_9SPHN|nr:hypothetical protein [Novosphingobium chloroacetimidivorans]MBB4858261.1 hypothetical protein [Novosphingobium chloroacetimidivorans]